ncbi:MAG: hypothetical protein ABIJ00_14220 [Candidatus Eisenbacteria bacterium]
MKRRPGLKTIVVLAVLFAAGALHWVLFLHSGNMTFRAHDWGKEFIYYSLFKQALTTGEIPFHISLAFHDTPRFLALPETNLSPQILLLPLMSVGQFILVNILILYSIGFVGCLLIRQRYRLSLIPFSILFLLFNFNGHITAHIGVGHSMWAGYFLLPFFFLFVLDLAGGNVRPTTPIKIAFVLFAILLQGGLHIFMWCMTFLVLLLAFNWRYVRPILTSVLLTLVMSAFRLIPATFALAGKKEKFIWSYPTLRDVLDAIITIRQQAPERLRPWGTAGWWELDIYMGIIGLALIVYFGIFLRFSKREDLKDLRFKPLDLPVFIMALFSISYFHAFLTRLPIPLLSAERVATRFIIIPVLLLALLAVIRMERVLTNLKQTFASRVIAVGAVLIMVLGFVDHSFLWSVTRLERICGNRVVDLTTPDVISRPDPLYKNLLLVSAALSIAGIALSLYFAFRHRSDRI